MDRLRILITGSAGLIGGEAVEYFGTRGHEVVGVDNNARRLYFGEAGDTLWNLHRVAHKAASNYTHHEADICDGPLWYFNGKPREDKRPIDALTKYVFQGPPFDAVIHCAAQPSHDFATQNPELDHRVNVKGTHNLLEATLRHSPQAVFIFMSTNKVYDNWVNQSIFSEYETRWDVPWWPGFSEQAQLGADDPFGQHKLEADQLVRDYRSRYGLKTMVLRGGCLTGPGHSGVELHGFLSYLIRCAITGTTYKIFGFGGKQVRDNIHSHDVCAALEQMIRHPNPGEAYNIGGGRENSISIIEAIAKIEALTGLKIKTEYVDEPRHGDHRCYITDIGKLKGSYSWGITKNLDTILGDMLQQMYWGKYSDHEDTKAYDIHDVDIVMDVGGYRGAFTADLLARYPDAQFHVYEPTQEFFGDCVRRFEGKDNVTICKAGLAGAAGQVILAKQGQNTSAFRGGAGQERLPVDPIYGAAVPESVELIDAAAEVERFGYVKLMSLNCEGGEYDVLLRLIASGAIKRIQNVQVQFHRFHPQADQLRDHIRSLLHDTHRERFCYPWVWESWSLR